MSEAPRRPVALHDIEVTFRNRLGRAAWGVVHLLLYRPSPRTAHGWRRMLLRLFGAQIGPHAHPYSSASIWAPWHLIMEEGSALGDHVVCHNNTTVHLAPYATISQHSYLCTASRDIDRPGRPVVGAPIHIGRDAWVAVQCYIGPGVSIGDNAVVGARSTVTRDVGANMVVAGSPPRLLRMR